MGTRRLLPIAIGLAALLGVVSTAGPLTTRVETPQTAQKPPAVELPNRPGSLKFGVIGDFGNGSRQQTELGTQMAKLRARFPFEFVITVGDNIYGGDRPQDMYRKFELPYKALLDGGVKFYASLGNHDDRAQARYSFFNMNGRTYYTFKAPEEDVRFFALETDYLNAPQVAWIEKELASSNERWKIPYFHHPLYSSGEKHGSDDALRAQLEPLFLKHGVDVVFAGHEHFYERLKPQQGIYYFTAGGSAKLRPGNIRRGPLTAVGFDTDRSFLLVELTRDALHFQALDRQGKRVDAGQVPHIDRKTATRTGGAR
jgi:predicted phosphodiesterase